MGLNPKIERRPTSFRKCAKCGQTLSAEEFAPSKSLFFDGYVPFCADCVNSIISENDYNWAVIDKICQAADIPFIPSEWERIKALAPNNTFQKYAEVFLAEEYQNLGWDDYYKAFKQLELDKEIEDELPGFKEKRLEELKERWGPNYDEEALAYLENLYNGVLNTQNVSGALSFDQAFKLCKISYEIDCRIREGSDFDKLLASYDKLVRIADFTPKNSKNASDFESLGELVKWLEKRGWKNKFYDNVSRDIVDETIKNIQSWSQRLYTEETGISEEIDRRIEALKSAKVLEDGYFIQDTLSQDELDRYQNEGFEKLYDNEAFKEDIDDG